MKKIIRWQPEWAQTIIYWSLSMILLFFSLILSLENTRPYWKSNLVLGIFLVFLFLGYRRSFILSTHSIKIRYAAFWKDQIIKVQDIDEVLLAKHGIKVKFVGKKEPTIYLMQKNKQSFFLTYLHENELIRKKEKK
ncbi:MAG: EbsA family protein [Enterococcus lacertideformus]|uniref:EbsA family protein n=1 Tax=Enterococcus lacertideformus TaxID=2771493 RepID=A0A931FB23_9ENTE|nr:EbsA family protein [Enterococcus lacertideformus]